MIDLWSIWACLCVCCLQCVCDSVFAGAQWGVERLIDCRNWVPHFKVKLVKCRDRNGISNFHLTDKIKYTDIKKFDFCLSGKYKQNTADSHISVYSLRFQNWCYTGHNQSMSQKVNSDLMAFSQCTSRRFSHHTKTNSNIGPVLILRQCSLTLSVANASWEKWAAKMDMLTESTCFLSDD